MRIRLQSLQFHVPQLIIAFQILIYLIHNQRNRQLRKLRPQLLLNVLITSKLIDSFDFRNQLISQIIIIKHIIKINLF